MTDQVRIEALPEPLPQKLTKWRCPPLSLPKNLEPFYRYCANAITRAIWRPRYIGFDKIPATGPAILVSNHVSYADGPVINAALKRPVRYVIDEDIYNLPGINYFMKLNKAIPISPNRASVERALEAMSQALREGDLVCIFPEGQLTYTGSLGRFKPGVEHMVRRDPVPVYPIALHGLWGSVLSRKYLGSWRRWVPRSWKQKTLAICGDPILPDDVTINYLQEIVLKLKYSLGQLDKGSLK